MKSVFYALLVLGVSGSGTLSSADDEKSPVITRIGRSAPDWKGLVGVDGKEHSLAQITDKYVVVIFFANHCSLCQFQEKELIKIQSDYQKQSVQLIAISVSNSEDDRLPKMIERAKGSGYNFPYLHDPTQNVARGFDATRTPMAFLLNEKRKIVYCGAVNDDDDPVKNHYLRNALNDLIAGRPIREPETRSFGCGIRYE